MGRSKSIFIIVILILLPNISPIQLFETEDSTDPEPFKMTRGIQDNTTLYDFYHNQIAFEMIDPTNRNSDPSSAQPTHEQVRTSHNSITLDASVVFSSTPGNVEINESADTYQLEWIGDDTDQGICILGASCPDTYLVLVNGTEFIFGDWNSNQPIIVEVGDLSKGLYEISMTINDSKADMVTDVMYLTVLDQTTPDIIDQPSNIQFSENSSGHNLTWIFEDLYPDSYAIYRNNVLVNASSWQSNSPITEYIDGLTNGFYNFTISVNDTSNNVMIGQVNVTVLDEQQPVFLEIPANSTIEFGLNGNTLDWLIYEDYPGNYTVYLNGGTNTIGQYMNSTTISYSLDGLGLGIHNITIFVNDSSGNSNTYTVFVTVEDTTSPTISDFADLILEDGEIRPEIAWNLTDFNPEQYFIYQNGSVIVDSTWVSNENITHNLDDLDLGTYNITLEVFDSFGNSNTHTVIVSIVDTISPLITYETLQYSFDESIQGTQISWEIFDLHYSSFQLLRNNVSYLIGNYNTITVNIDDFQLGIYNFTIIANDTSSNLGKITVFIEIIDINKPTLEDNYGNLTYSEFTTGNVLTVNVSDSFPDYYDYFVDEVFNSTSSWDNDGSISIIIDGFTKGNYSLKLVIFDTSGNNLTIIVNLEVSDIPVFKNLPDIQFFNSTIDQHLQWVLSASNPDYYIIYHDNTTLQEGNWVNNEMLSVDLSSFYLGLHNFTIFINDTSGNYAIHSHIVLITDIPSMISSPPNVVISEAMGEYFLNWTIIDDKPGSYVITIDGSEVENGSWNDSISYHLINLVKGSYLVEIYIFDIHGNMIFDIVEIEVEDLTSPVITVEDLVEIEYSGNQSIWFMAEDAYPLLYQLYLDDLLISDGGWISQVNTTLSLGELSLGRHNLTITFTDGSGNLVISTQLFDIVDTTSPVVNYSGPLTFNYNETPSYTLNASDFFPSYYTIFLNGNLVVNSTWNDNNLISYTISDLEYGSGSLSIYFYDLSSNYVEIQLNLQITDLYSPAILQLPANATYSEGETSSLTWQFGDKYPGVYSIFVNNENIESGSWSNLSIFSFALEDLTKGVYFIQLQFQDQSSNLVSIFLRIEIRDRSAPNVISSSIIQDIPLLNRSVLLWWNVEDNHPSTFEIYVNNSYEFEGLWEDRIEWLFFASQQGNYVISLVVYDEDNNYTTYNSTLHFYIISTLVPKIDFVDHVYEGDMQNITETWVGDVLNPDGNLRITIFTDNNSIIQTTDSPIEDGRFFFQLDYTGFLPGIYTLRIQFEAFGFENHTKYLSFEVIRYSYLVSLEYDTNIQQGDAYEISITISRLRDAEIANDGLQLSEYIQKSSAVSGINVLLAIEYVYLDGSHDTLRKEGLTGIDGTIIFLISSSETNLISNIRSISTKVPELESLNANIFQDYPEEPPMVISTGNFLLKLLLIISRIAREYTLIVISSILITVLVLLLSIRKRRRTISRKKLYEHALREIETYLSIRSLMVIGVSGVPYARLNPSRLNVENSLIGGFTSAISSFLSEIETSDAKGFELIERSGISILTHKTDLSTFIIVANERIQDDLKPKIMTSHKNLENEFYDLLEADTGEQITELEFVEELMLSRFYIGLVGKVKLFSNRDKLEQDNFNEAEIKATNNIDVLNLMPRYNRGYTIHDIYSQLESFKISRQFTAYLVLKLLRFGYLKLMSESLEGISHDSLSTGQQETNNLLEETNDREDTE